MKLNSLQISQKISVVLDDNKAINIQVLDIRELTDFADYFIVCSGTSGRHVHALSRHVHTELAKDSVKPLGSEGEEFKDWVLVDYVDVVVHIMSEEAREHYDLESLWSKNVSKKNQPAEA